jgi:hypothetical protein
MFKILTKITAIFCLQSALLFATDLKPEDIVARHLDSFGTTEARAASKTRVVQGQAEFKIRVGGGGSGLPGTSGLVSDGRKSVLLVKLSNNDYRGEQFVTDGDKVRIPTTTANHRRSSLGEFVYSQDQIVSEGLMGGTLTTAWALLNLDANKPKLSDNGERKIGGGVVYEIGYHSKKKDDLTIHSLTLASGLAPIAGGSDITQSVMQKETRYTIEENFSDFKTAEGLTLPSKYVIHFTQELQNGTTQVYEWDIAADEFSNNVGLDPKNFEVK